MQAFKQQEKIQYTQLKNKGKKKKKETGAWKYVPWLTQPSLYLRVTIKKKFVHHQTLINKVLKGKKGKWSQVKYLRCKEKYWAKK